MLALNSYGTKNSVVFTSTLSSVSDLTLLNTPQRSSLFFSYDGVQLYPLQEQCLKYSPLNVFLSCARSSFDPTIKKGSSMKTNHCSIKGELQV
mmetsp:Transcript_34305/g.42014  ORF Transcript_34305/g.42014 Transcript_34305/m.42014 type:complete len:93 (+) Transcript_34305:3031-3309(+)